MSNSYWLIPEDIQKSWSILYDVFQGHLSCNMTIRLVIKDRAIQYISEPEICNLQPRSRQLTNGTSWWNVIRQIQSVGMNIHKVALLSMNITINRSGNPVIWTEPDIRSLKSY